MNPADKTIQELTQSLHQSQETIEQLTKILSKSEKRSQLLERTFRWLAVLFICLTMTVFYVGFDWVNKAQATAEKETTLSPDGMTATRNDNQGQSNLKKVEKFKGQRENCREGMQLMMVKQAQDLLLTRLTLNKEIQQLPQSPEKDQLVRMNEGLGEKLKSFFPNMDNIFKDNSRIVCDVVVQVMNITRKLEQFKADWNRVRDVLLHRLYEIKTDNENETEPKPKKPDLQPKEQEPLYRVAKQILDYLQGEGAIEIKEDNRSRIKIVVKSPSQVDSALSTLMALGVMEGIAGLNNLGGIQRALDAVPAMNANMRDMNIHMYHMMRNMGVMSYDMDSTLGRAGRNMPWMPW